MSILKNVICCFMMKPLMLWLKSRMWKQFYLAPEDIFPGSKVNRLFGKL